MRPRALVLTAALLVGPLAVSASPLIPLSPQDATQAVFSPQLQAQTTVKDTPEGTDEFPEGWRDPRLGGGSMINFATKKYGEPINVIITGTSDRAILTDAGLEHYAMSLGFADECLKQHRGGAQRADLGDGAGIVPQHFMFRQHYFPIFGTCWESLAGGHHFRAWHQNGTLANTGAWFLAVSQEKDLGGKHMIVPDGYNIGRDWLVEKAVQGGRWKGYWWKADVEWRSGLLEPGSEGINHNITQDGLVAILTVRRV